jgi:hypothetical protein
MARADVPWIQPGKGVARSAEIVPESRELVNRNAAPTPLIYLNDHAGMRRLSIVDIEPDIACQDG